MHLGNRLLRVASMYQLFNKIAEKYNKYRMKSPYLYICELDKAMDKLKDAVYQQKNEKELIKSTEKVLHLAGKLSLTDAVANYHAPSRDKSSRNCAVVATAYGCVTAALEGTNDFSDWLEKYLKASRVAQGLDNFKEMEYYGHLLDISIHGKFSRKDAPETLSDTVENHDSPSKDL
ncbi:hypothetical protein [Legionella rubrilucens]|nr:hypothetical protein [Legionella rubrilucens]